MSSSPASRIALCGLGGVGKSQLAIEYCYRVREKSPNVWVLWVHASNPARLELSFRDIAERLKIPGRNDPQASVFELLYNWLHDAKRGKWVLILDNLDDENLLRESLRATNQNDGLRRPFISFLPQCGHGTILLTTRYRKVARQVVNECNIIRIDPMQEPFALALMTKKLKIEAAEEDVRELVETLEFMPLAIVQAASYITQQAPLCSVPRYLKIFRKNHRLLDHEAGHPQRDFDASNSILVTWRISFDYIRQFQPSGADLLSLMSFFDRQGIPRKLLHGLYKKSESDVGVASQSNSDSEDNETDSDDGIDINHDIMLLRDFGFISINQNPESLEMHRLVQLAQRDWLEIRGRHQYWNEKFINILRDEFLIDKGDLELFKKLFPHVMSAMLERPTSKAALLSWAALLYEGSVYAMNVGNYSDMKSLALKAKTEREALLGPEDLSTLSSTRQLSAAYFHQAKWSKAEALQFRLVEYHRKTFGDDHHNTIIALADLCLTYREQGEWKKAENLQVPLLQKSERVLGEDHHDTIVIALNLVGTYCHLGKFDVAENMAVELLQTCKRVMGEGHITTIVCMSNLLGKIYICQDRFEDAERLLKQGLNFIQEYCPDRQSDYLTTTSHLALAYQHLQRWRESEELYIQMLTIQKQVFGEAHPQTLSTMNNMGQLYEFQARYSESVHLHEHVYKVENRLLGDEHPSTIVSLNNLAVAYRGQGRRKDAEEILINLFEKSQRVLGEDHPNTIKIRNNLIETQGRWKDMFDITEGGPPAHVPSLTCIPMPSTSNHQNPSKVYRPAQARDVFEVFSIIRRCGKGRLPRHVILRIMDFGRYWLLHRAWRMGTMCVTERGCRERISYLKTQLLHGLQYPMKELLIRISSHDQSKFQLNAKDHGTFQKSNTWFDLGIERPPGREYDGLPKQGTICANIYLCSGFQEHHLPINTSVSNKLEAGDQISIIPMAGFGNWSIL
ncbi:hypothetical protein N7451_009815 [Penicillium sp. IBT 35674x]|nr:hypothetical protein N7451_009815 [Penicillium sp. IBT 35674x]